MCSPMVRDSGVQTHVDLYQRLKNGTWCRLAQHSVLKGKDQG